MLPALPFLDLRLHHVGFVVADISSQIGGFCQSLNCNWNGEIVHDPIQKVRVAFLNTPRASDAQIELVEPAGSQAPVLRFLQEKGGGLHHLCYEVPGLDAQITEMRARGALIVRRPQPAAAFGGRRIAWLLTKERLLVELLELPAA
jgi:methylmalonyl-CoA/ethylmalonyl-CoA epimerase